MTSLGFENYAEALKIYLTKYRDVSIAYLSASPRSAPRISEIPLRAVWQTLP
jgi:hypothetical protein